MTAGTLHPVPRVRDVVLEQIRIVAHGLRPVAVVGAVVFGIITIFVAVDVVRGDAASWFDSDEWSPIAFVSFLFPFAVWRKERRFGPAFLWTLPVDRRRLALARVFAGWVWLITALVILLCWQLALAAVSRVSDPEIVSLIAIPAATAMYLLGSALVLGLRHPLRWLFGAAGVVYLVAMLRETFDGRGGIDALVESSGLVSAVEKTVGFFQSLPPLGQWAAVIFLWIGAGLAALWAAVSRHREDRRR